MMTMHDAHVESREATDGDARALTHQVQG